uniref:Uncharacterized protein n=1 Tax=Helianthus annuus TaxID=4232 RepID=A0A251VQR6_HELAN
MCLAHEGIFIKSPSVLSLSNTHHQSLYPSSLSLTHSQPNPHHCPHLEIESGIYVKLLFSLKATSHSTLHLRETPPQLNLLSPSPPPS